jgi:Ankyrin repeats (many copies)
MTNRYYLDLFWDAALRDNLAEVRRYAVGGLDVNAADTYGLTAFHKAALASSGKVLKFLLKMQKVDIEKPDGTGMSPAESARQYANNERIAAAIEAEVRRRKKRVHRVPQHSL